MAGVVLMAGGLALAAAALAANWFAERRRADYWMARCRTMQAGWRRLEAELAARGMVPPAAKEGVSCSCSRSGSGTAST
jgi:hypothetical protein